MTCVIPRCYSRKSNPTNELLSIFTMRCILFVYPTRGTQGEAGMSDSTRQNRLHSVVGLVAEYVVTGLITLMTLVTTLRMLGIVS